MNKRFKVSILLTIQALILVQNCTPLYANATNHTQAPSLRKSNYHAITQSLYQAQDEQSAYQASQANTNGHYRKQYQAPYTKRIHLDAWGHPAELIQTGPSGTVLLQTTNHYNARGMLVEVDTASAKAPQDTRVNYLKTLYYDDFNQLVDEKTTSQGKCIHQSHYVYDGNGNVLTKTEDNKSTTYQYNNLDQLTQYFSDQRMVTPHYDANGSLLDDGAGNRYYYNGLGQLVGVSSNHNGVEIRYRYYPNGLRASRDEGTTNQHFYYRGQNIDAVDDTSGHTSFVMDGDQRIQAYYVGSYSYKPQSDLSYVSDGKNMVMTLGADTNQNNGVAVKGSSDYTPYGIPQGELKTTAVTSFGYNGEYQDPKTHLVYLRARDYDPAQGRFLTVDSYGVLQGVWNKYNFADANPMMMIDPSGHISFMQGINLGINSIALIAAIITADPVGASAAVISIAQVTLNVTNLIKPASKINTIFDVAGIAIGLLDFGYQSYTLKYKTYLGEGDYGVAFKRGSRVYKFRKGLHPESEPARNARLWNEFYTHAYEGRFKHFATARVLGFGNHKVLSTPFITEANRDFLTLSDQLDAYDRFNHDLSYFLGREMMDYNVPGNLVKHLHENNLYLLPVDFDQVVVPAARSGELSPGSREVANIYHYEPLSS